MRNATRRTAAVLSVLVALAIVPVPSFAAPVSEVAQAIAPAATTTADLKCVTMVTDTLAYAAGAYGTIIKTTDGGDNWVKLTTGTTTADFRGIAFWDANNGVAVTYGRAVYRTANGGTSWTLANPDMTQYAAGTPLIGVNAVAVLPSMPGVASLAGGDPNAADDSQFPAETWRTSNFGANWGSAPRVEDLRHPETLGAEITYVGEGEFLGMDFIDSQHGWAVGDDLYSADATAPVYATADGGLNWTLQTFGLPLRLTGVAFGSLTNGVIVSSAGRVFRTTNGGSVWTEGTQPVTSAINGVDMTSATSGWAAGATGKLLGTTNGGSSWTLATSPTSQDLAAIALSGTRGIAVGKFGTVVITTDGSNWRAPVPDTTGPTMTALTSSTHPDEATWYPAGSATISWTATDASEVTGYSYVFDTSASTNPDTTSEGSSVTATRSLGDGVNYVHVRAVDVWGNWGAAIHRAIRVDVTKPSTAHDAHALYDGMAATITLTPTDATSGVAKTEYAVDGAPSVEGTTVIVAAGGDHTLAFASTDRAGNKETTTTVDFTVIPPQTDFDGPVVTALSASPQSDPGRWYLQRDAIVSWVATDATDVTGYAYAFDTTADTVPSTSTVITQTNVSEDGIADGTYYAHVRATDHYANWGETRHFMIKIDGTMPTTGANASTPSGEDATVTISATDALSGVARIDWVVDGGSAGSVTGSSGSLSATVSLTGVMLHHVDYSATDGAGNREATKTIDVPIPRPDTQYVAVEGPNRYATAVAASNLAFPDGADAVVIATGTNWPDALGGAALAGQVNGPILLTDPKTLPSAVQGEIVRLGATTAYILGSEAAVSKAVADAVDAIPGVSITRLAGPNRYATANAIARATTDLEGSSYDGTMFVATGLNFPDALAASPLSAAKGWPLYLASPTGLTAETLTTMKSRGSRVYILGSAAAVPTLVENQLKAAFPGAVTRLQGGDRYATGLAIAEFGTGPGGAGLTWRSPALATGTNFPDALSGGVLQGLDGSILLLTNGTSLTPSVGVALGLHKADIREVRYLGSTSAVSDAVRSSVNSILQ